MTRIPECQAQLDALTHKYLSDPEPSGNGHRASGPPPDLSDEEVIDLCRKAKNSPKFSDLNDAGDTSLYEGDDSRADLALMSMYAFYTQHPAQLERLFDNSALGQRPKWKNRPDYRRRTIEKVLKGPGETYTPPPKERTEISEEPREKPRLGGESPNIKRIPFRNTTDLGNAERLVDMHGEDLRYVHDWGRFIVYDGQRWGMDRNGTVKQRAKDTVRSIYHEAGDATDADARRDLVNHAKRSEAQSRIEAMISLAKADVPILPEELDADPWLLNVENGVVELRTGEMRSHRREDYVTKIAGTYYNPDATAPNFEAFLERVLPSESLRRFVQRAVGCSLTGDVSEQALLFLHGAGANGKSTLINVILALLGEYGQQAAPELLTAKAGTHPTELADLKGTRFAACVEVEDGRRLAESLVKQLTGGDRIKARFMRQDFFEFDPTHKIFLAANHKPTIRGTDHGIWRRIKLVPFEVTISKEEQDPSLFEKLRQELPGILAWAVKGCLDWQEHGLDEPEEVRKATDAYRAEMDVLAAFLDECCMLSPSARTRAKALYAAYRGWCEANGEHAEKQKSFGMRLTERGFERRRSAPDGGYEWHGIGLLYEGCDPDPLKKTNTLNDPEPKSDITTENGAHVAQTRNSVQYGSVEDVSSVKAPADGCIETKATRTRRRPTPEKETQVQKLITEGMEPGIARAEVLKEEEIL
jgi:putative DNA primase/helicase